MLNRKPRWLAAREALTNVRARAVAGAVLLSPLAVIAQDDPSDPFMDAIASATTNLGTYGAALVGLAAVAVVFMIAIKYVKKIPRAS